MTIDHRTGALTSERLGPPNLAETFGFLERDPVLNVYLLALTLRDALARPADEFWGVRRDGELVALLHVGSQSGAVLPIGDDPVALRMLAECAHSRLETLPSRFQVIGPRAAVMSIHERLRRTGIKPRLLRRQTYMAVDRGRLTAFERVPELRRAAREDYDLLYASGAMLRLEELEEDPRLADPASYAKRVEEECRDGYTHLWIDRDGLCFRSSVSALTPEAAQVSGVYTPPDRRNRGFATRGLSELCARLFERSRAACLFVNDFNAPAIAVYRRLGFEVRAEWASAFYSGADWA
jgi:ribosomal protein S18 acetylase RimI-like enzyme